MNHSKKDVILESAAMLFSEKGYAATSMRDLAREVGMEAASLYNHIKSKQEILSVILLDIADLFIDGIEEIENLDNSPLEKIRALISLHIRITVNNPDNIALVTQEWRHLEGDSYLLFNAQKIDYEKRFKKIIISGIFQGQIKRVNSDIALFSILSSLRWFYEWYNKQNGFSIKELEAQFSDVLIGGLAA